MQAGHIRHLHRAPHSRAAPFARLLVIMVKVPVAGRVKTRLARQVGANEATRFYRHTLHAVVRRLAVDPRWRTILAVAPDTGMPSPALPRLGLRVPQGQGDLGRRMQRLMQLPRPGPLLIVGTDIPAIRRSHIADAFRRLGGNDAVFGPTPDGGYWLVGLSRTPRIRRPFTQVRWSSAHALADTQANLSSARSRLTAPLADVDGPEDFARVRGWFGRLVLPAEKRRNPEQLARE